VNKFASLMPTASPQSTTIPFSFDKINDIYDEIFVIMSPPRCSSTAFSRVFWEQPTVRYYSHEPFEIVYYRDQRLTAVAEKLEQPLDLQGVKYHQNGSPGNSLVIKEMPYQVGRHFPVLASLAKKPIIFLMRDPRLNIASRMEKKVIVGDNPIFPKVESGWKLLMSQVDYCKLHNIPYIIVDSTDFRNYPVTIFQQVFARFRLPFSEDMLSWRVCDDVDLDNLDGQHHHLYERVLRSTAVQPATEPIPSLDRFPTTNGFRTHVRNCLELYETLRQDATRIRVYGSVSKFSP